MRLDQQINLDNMKILRQRVTTIKPEVESSLPVPPPAAAAGAAALAPPYHGDSGVDE